MPCTPVDVGGITYIACSRGGRRPAPCWSCGVPSTKLCDGEVVKPYGKHNIGTCDRPLCDACTTPAGKNKDHCLVHKKEKDMTAEGLFHVPGFLSAGEIAGLIEIARRICTEAPLRRPTMPDGTPLKLTLTNAGDFGWWSDSPLGYRYIMKHPTTGKPFPQIPPVVRMVALRALGRCNLPTMEIENCLINHYAPGESLGLHVDRTEDDKDAPIISLSIGADAEFAMGGREREDRTEKFCLRSGDLVVQSGPSRKYFHGITKIFPTMGNPLKDGGRLNFTMRRVTRSGASPIVELLKKTPYSPANPSDDMIPCVAGCGSKTTTGVCASCAQKEYGDGATGNSSRG